MARSPGMQAASVHSESALYPRPIGRYPTYRFDIMTRLHRRLTLLLILLALALVGCSAISSDEAPASDSEQVAAATVEPIEEPTQVVEPTATAEPEPTEVAIGPPPAFREELEATDPATVVLGAGQPQVVELFAFW